MKRVFTHRYVLFLVLLSIGIYLRTGLLTAKGQESLRFPTYLPIAIAPQSASDPAAPSSTATPVSTAAATNTPDSGTIVVPPATPTPTPPPDNEPIPPYAGAPECDAPLHDVRAWHSLWNEEHGCHYNHEHKNDPRTADDLFGTEYYQWAGGELSYPWQTFHGANDSYPPAPAPGYFENDMKHEGYGWIVRRDMPCFATGDKTGCITDMRVQYHAIFAGPGAVTRFHSYWVEARVCPADSPSTCGIIRTGGWMDFGYLLVRTRVNSTEFEDVHVALPGDPPESSIDIGSPRRIHPGDASGEYQAGSFWYGQQRYKEWLDKNVALLHSLHLSTDDVWQNIDVDDASAVNLYCPEYDCNKNDSVIELHQLGFRVDTMAEDVFDPDGDGFIDYSGYTDRYGILVDGCSEPGLDCVPLILEHVPFASYQYRDDTQGSGRVEPGMREHDIAPDSESWIEYPN